MNTPIIPAYIINLKKRADRRAHILREFAGRDEFAVKMVDAIADPVGAVGLWKTIRHILQNEVSEEDEFILICEDDHQFTEQYSKEYLWQCIDIAKNYQAEIVLGGISWLTGCFRVKENIFWVEKFSGLQFTIIFKRFFEKIVKAEFAPGDAADHTMSCLAQSKFVIHPFISVQKEFGYSDATLMNNATQRVDELFATSAHNIKTLISVETFFKSNNATPAEPVGDFCIPTYIIGQRPDNFGTAHIRKQFHDKPEFDLLFIEKPAHDVRSSAIWKTIQMIVRLSIQNDDDLIIICNEAHVFTKHYNKEWLFANIVEAHYQYADFLVGGTDRFGFALPVGANRFWCDECYAMPFIVLYKKIFSKIVTNNCPDELAPGKLLSQLGESRMLLYPFISKQQSLPASIINGNMPNDPFDISEHRLHAIHQAYSKLMMHPPVPV